LNTVPIVFYFCFSTFFTFSKKENFCRSWTRYARGLFVELRGLAVPPDTDLKFHKILVKLPISKRTTRRKSLLRRVISSAYLADLVLLRGECSKFGSYPCSAVVPHNVTIGQIDVNQIVLSGDDSYLFYRRPKREEPCRPCLRQNSPTSKIFSTTKQEMAKLQQRICERKRPRPILRFDLSHFAFYCLQKEYYDGHPPPPQAKNRKNEMCRSFPNRPPPRQTYLSRTKFPAAPTPSVHGLFDVTAPPKTPKLASRHTGVQISRDFPLFLPDVFQWNNTTEQNLRYGDLISGFLATGW
jgi:hypothetical protein